jgi:hypothetical protein
VGHVVRMVQITNVYKILVGNAKEITEMDVKETGCESVDCIHLTRDRDQWRTLVKTVMKLRVP